MNTVELTAVVMLGGLLAGFVGALTGLGGGVVVVPAESYGWFTEGFDTQNLQEAKALLEELR